MITIENNSTTYHVANMRFVPTTGKVKVKNPDRVGTVYGEFHADQNGKPAKDALSITQKVIDLDTAANPLTRIDVENGILVLPSGERGRKAVAGIDQDSINSLLAAARGESDEDGESDDQPTAE